MIRHARLSQALLVTTFCGLITLPALTGRWSGDGTRSGKPSSGAAAPRVALAWEDPRRFVESVERYFNGRLGLRQDLVEWHSRLKYFVLGVSASPDVLLGKDGWLYWAQKEDGDPIAYFRGVKTLSDDDLSELGGILQARSDWMKARGVMYVFLVAPNKETIYPEYLPGTVTRLREESHLDRFGTYAARHTTLVFVDPRRRLLEAKRHMLTYHRTDTHWNAHGAHAAYEQLVEVLRSVDPRVTPLALSTGDFRHVPGAWPYVVPSMRWRSVDATPGESGDLAGMLGLQRILRDVSVVPREAGEGCARVVPTRYRPKGWETVRDGPDPSLGHGGLLTTTCEGRPLHVLVIHDSFGPLLIPFLSESFGQVTYAWVAGDFEFAKEFVENAEVDITIQVHAERHLLPDVIY